jgi:integrase
VLNILSTLSSMLATAANWGYASREVELSKLVLPDRNAYVPAHFTRSHIESILSLAGEPWRTFFIVLILTGLRAGEALGLQWPDIDFDHKCIHIRRFAWYGKAQSTKSKASVAPVTLPYPLAVVLEQYRSTWTANPDGGLFATRNNRPPSSNKVLEYRLWPIFQCHW